MNSSFYPKEELESIIEGNCPYTKMACPCDCPLDDNLKCNVYKEAMKIWQDSPKAGVEIDVL